MMFRTYQYLTLCTDVSA